LRRKQIEQEELEVAEREKERELERARLAECVMIAEKQSESGTLVHDEEQA